MQHSINSAQTSPHTPTPNKVVPLLAQVGRVEELLSALTVRLDPIVVHNSTVSDEGNLPSFTVTSRLQSVGDALQYLLDNIEL